MPSAALLVAAGFVRPRSFAFRRLGRRASQITASMTKTTTTTPPELPVSFVGGPKDADAASDAAGWSCVVAWASGPASAAAGGTCDACDGNNACVAVGTASTGELKLIAVVGTQNEPGVPIAPRWVT